MMRLQALVLALVVAAMPQAGASDDLLAGQLGKLLAEAEAGGASGVLRVARRGEVVFESGYGSATCDGSVPVAAGQVFMIGSITKEFTRLLGFVLDERGVLSLDDTLDKWLPGFDGPSGKVTLLQVMDHVAGLPDLIDDSGEPVPYTIEYDYTPVSRDQLIAKAGLASLIHEPGREKEYSNLGYQLLAAVYELATGERYPDLLRRYVYAPAGMTATGFWFDDRSPERFVEGCSTGDVRWGNPVTDGKWDESGPSWNLLGAGGLLSTAESLDRFLQGVGEGVYFETAEQSERFKDSRMAYSERRRQRVLGSAGSNGIFNAVALWRDGDEVSIVLMTNRADHPGEAGLITDVAGLVD